MSKPVTFRYAVYFGLSGCYLPDSSFGPYTGTTRRELVAMIKGELEAYGLPAYLIRKARIRDFWSVIARHGSSSVHFSFDHGANTLSFSGLTEQEASDMEAQQDC